MVFAGSPLPQAVATDSSMVKVNRMGKRRKTACFILFSSAVRILSSEKNGISYDRKNHTKYIIAQFDKKGKIPHNLFTTKLVAVIDKKIGKLYNYCLDMI